MKPLLGNRLLLIYILSFIIAGFLFVFIGALEGAYLGARMALQNIPTEKIGELVTKATDKMMANMYQVALVITYFGLALWIFKRYVVSWTAEIRWQPASFSETFKITVWLLSLAIGYVMLASWLLPQDYFHEPQIYEIYGKPNRAVGEVASFLALGILAPLLEEWIFRGFIMQSYLRRRGAAFALYAQTLLFALVHGEPVIATHALLMGWILGRWVLSGRSLTSAFFAHALNNIFAFSLSYVGTPLTLHGNQSSALVGVLGLILIVIVLVQAVRHTPIANQPAWEPGPVFSGSLVLPVLWGLSLFFISVVPS